MLAAVGAASIEELFEDIPMASTTFVAELIREDMLIEVDVWAIAP